ncbi:MAG TPA: hypothetical protein VKP14_11770, partial [Gaiellaceae bacterium]|nr:hypothetical protein [Gaiellaceae bacterium]
AAIHGSQDWKPLQPVSVVWGEPMTFAGMPAGSKGYRAASEQIEAELHRLWEWLYEQHAAGRPRAVALP